MKKCTQCGEIKPLVEFNTRKNKTGRVPFPECKVCGNARNKANYEKNREAVIARTIEYNRVHRDQINSRTRSKNSTSVEEITAGKKTCKKCGGEKTIQAGEYWKCKPCNDISNKNTYDQNRDAVLAHKKAYREENLYHMTALSKANYARNRESKLAYNKRYMKENWEKQLPRILAKNATRRANKVRATPKWANQSKIQELYVQRDLIQKATCVAHTVDHWVPLNSPNACGLHWEGNLRVITDDENSRKSNLYWPDMWDYGYGTELPQPVNNEWVGMPEFVQEEQKPYSQITIRIANADDLKEFSELIEQKLTDKTKSIWYPELTRGANSKKRWCDES